MTISIDSIVLALQNELTNDQVTVNLTIRELHGRDESHHPPRLPDIVVFPKSTEDVTRIMGISQQYKMPIIPFGRGSSLEGNAIPTEGGITIDFSLMNKIVEIKENDFLVTVEPGVTREQLDKALKKFGLFFPVDPGADATLGGMAATNASGTTSVKYGVMRDQVRSLEVVLADGTVIHTGNLAVKSSSGYYLNGLFVGSEGTLGCFTKLTLQLHGIPEQIVAARASFPSINDAVEAVVSILQAGIPIARVELVDEDSMKQANLHSETNYKEVPTLFLEFHGNEAGLKQDIDFMKDIVEHHNCREVEFEKDNAARNKLWEARHNMAYAFIHGYPGKKMIITDVCVPLSELADAVVFAREQMGKFGLPGGIVGHVGDGNFHSLVMVDTNSEEELVKANELNEKIVLYALKRGGTCTGEHGVGIGKKKYQKIEHGSALLVMKSIKQTLDPHNLLNPNKIFDL